jgi:hypothetical protein
MFLALAAMCGAGCLRADVLERGCVKSYLRKSRSAGGFGNALEEQAALDAAVLEVS